MIRVTKSTMRLLPTFFILFYCFAIPVFAEDCLPYEPASVTLSGKLVKKTLPGEPNYENTTQGDHKETVWFLELPQAICVAPGKDAVQEGESAVKRIQLQLLLTARQKPQLSNWLGKSVKVSGSLFHAQSGHHHTKILLTVSDIE